jgi:hypothetical protein
VGPTLLTACIQVNQTIWKHADLCILIYLLGECISHVSKATNLLISVPLAHIGVVDLIMNVSRIGFRMTF